MRHSDLHPYARGFAGQVKTAVLALLAAATLCTQARAAQPQYVAAQGRILPDSGVIAVAASHDGGTPIVAKLAVRAGDSVQAGVTLAELTTHKPLQAALEEAREQTQLAAVRVGILAPNTIRIAQARLAAANAEVALAELGVAEALAAQEVAEKTLIEADAQAQAQRARLSGTWAENRHILENDGPPAREAAQLRFEQKMLDLQKAELADTHAGTTLRLQAQIAQAKAAVQSARQRVVNAKAAQEIAQAEVRNAEESTAIATTEHSIATQGFARAQLLAQTATLTAPISGTVLQINARVGEAVSPEGLLLLANLEKLHVEAEVYIDDVRHVAISQQATITGEAFAGELTGTVVRIGNMVTLAEIFARDPASFTDQRVVKVRIALDAPKNGAPLPSLPVHSRVLVRINRN